MTARVKTLRERFAATFDVALRILARAPFREPPKAPPGAFPRAPKVWIVAAIFILDLRSDEVVNACARYDYEALGFRVVKRRVFGGCETCE